MATARVIENQKIFRIGEDEFYVESSPEKKYCYRVLYNEEERTCTCGDYTSTIKKDPEYRCEHILTVENSNACDLEEQKPKLDERFIQNIQGRDFVVYGGILDLAHQQGLKAISVEAIQYPTEENGLEAICKATIESEAGEIYTELGDANPKNVNPKIARHVLRMAATRAKARALRDFTNIGMTCLEEIDADDVVPETKPKNSPLKFEPRMECEDEKDEANQVVNEIHDLVNRKGFDYKDIAILYRANFQARVIEEVLVEHDVPYRIENGTSFFEKFEVKGMIDYLRLIRNPESDDADIALKSIANIPNRYVSRAFLNELESFSMQKGLHLYQALRTIKIKVPFLKHNIKGLVKFLNPLIKKANKIGPAEMLKVLRISLDYDQFITQDEIPSADDMRIANLDQLELAASDFEDIASFLEHVDSFQSDEGRDEEGVVLSTVHKSKGLEYPAVFVINMLDGLMPYKNGGMEEERRICFVALSRAMKVLHLSYPKIYFGKPVIPSPFLTEIRDPARE